jgi:predicted O-methyltransferase YrrM
VVVEVDARVGLVLEMLANMHEDGTESFGTVFIDADKPKQTEISPRLLAMRSKLVSILKPPENPAFD